MRGGVLVLALGIGAAHAEPLSAVDWKNRTYNNGDQSIKLVDGEWEQTHEDGDYTETLSLMATVFGDLDGDGKAEAIVHTQYSGGGTGHFDSLDVYQESPAGPKKVGTLPGGDRGDGGIADVRLDGRTVVLVRNGSLLSDGACCPTLEITEQWRWVGGGLQIDPDGLRVKSVATAEAPYEALRKQGLAALKDQPQDAAALLCSALSTKQGDPTALQELGLALMRNKDALAIPVLVHAVAVSSEATQAATLYNLGRAYLNADDAAGAVEALQRSLSLRPNNQPTLVALEEARAKLKATGKPAGPTVPVNAPPVDAPPVNAPAPTKVPSSGGQP